MKIISGRYKAVKIKVPKGIRPVSLRVKKSCFDILAKVIEESSVLDLYAGSGSLGLEALSQGAKRAIFVDSSFECTQAIKTNIQALKVSTDTDILVKDSIESIEDFFRRKIYFDLIFLDPPYYQGTITKALHAIGEYDIVAPFGYVACFCYIKDKVPKDCKNLELILKRKYGQTLFLIYNKKPS
ncbi:MAG: 16S rRNA (guanine(966)-N(2))-methyltransferase RsmD [Candidatus Omnitrophica bacterium]|nr:16S rRNA (guanine(966)-N(2))-methyltransferase RsmD [Candidatus Omnitrophota bacterium]